MATRLYLVAATPATTTPSYDPAWATTANTARRTLSRSKAAPTETLGPYPVPTPGPAYACAAQLISPPMAAQTLTGTFSAVARAREVVFNDDVNKRARSVRVYTSDGITLRGTLAPFAATAPVLDLFHPTGLASGQSHADAVPITPLQVMAGDILVIELGYACATTGSTPQYEFVLGGAGTDHANADIDDTGTVPWVEFSTEILFQTDTYVPAFYGVDGSSSATGLVGHH